MSKVHFILDEAAALGKLEPVEDAVDKLRGYGVRLVFFYQSMAQLLKCFPEGQDQTLLSNTTQVFFGVNDPKTAEYVSNRLGEATILLTDTSQTRGTSWQTQMMGDPPPQGPQYSESSSTSWRQHGRKLLKPEEVMMLGERAAITFTAGVPPVRTTLLRYYEEPEAFLPARSGAVSSLGLGVKALAFLALSGLAALFAAGAVQDAGQRPPPPFAPAGRPWLPPPGPAQPWAPPFVPPPAPPQPEFPWQPPPAPVPGGNHPIT